MLYMSQKLTCLHRVYFRTNNPNLRPKSTNKAAKLLWGLVHSQAARDVVRPARLQCVEKPRFFNAWGRPPEILRNFRNAPVSAERPPAAPGQTSGLLPGQVSTACGGRDCYTAVGAGMHFSPRTQAFAPEKCANLTYTPSNSIELGEASASPNLSGALSTV